MRCGAREITPGVLGYLNLYSLLDSISQFSVYVGIFSPPNLPKMWAVNTHCFPGEETRRLKAFTQGHLADL